MGYELLEEIIELTDSSESLDVKLNSVAIIISRYFSFDQCAIYTFDEEKRVFNLSAISGNKDSIVQVYHDGEGAPWLAIKGDNPQMVNTSRKTGWRGFSDSGLTGFETAVVCPIKDDTDNYGTLYLKNKKKKILSSRRKKLLSVITLQLAMTIKTQRCISHLMTTNAQMMSMQTKLIHAEKLIALGEMAATLAHSIKNPLMSIGGFAKRLSQQFSKDSPLKGYVDMIVKESKRVEKVFDGILHFSTQKAFETMDEDINSILNDCLVFFEDELNRNKIKIVKDLKSGISDVNVDKEQLSMVFSNLFTNAIQSMKKGGTLTLKTYYLAPWITVEVSDTGGGIEPDIIGNIFNPFFTTKPEGTGLGLAIAHNVIANHKGRIDVANNIGKGVTFIVKLPASKKGGI
ncbi:MAG: GAF domain-containing protein [Deltaproteobacteria bacterium]|nr:GAF domain-containing protein [Deltaproteobacteria bacterium]